MEELPDRFRSRLSSLDLDLDLGGVLERFLREERVVDDLSFLPKEQKDYKYEKK